MSAAKDEPLRRDIGLTGSAFLSFNGVVGAGIFALPGTLYEKFGAFSPFLFPLFGLLVLVVALPFARVAAHHRVSGGPVVYAAVFGPAASFQAGWLYYVARAAALAANLTVLVTYLGKLWPPLADPLPRSAAILAVVAAVVVANAVGVKRAVRLLDALTLLKAAPLLIVALAGLVVAGASIDPVEGLPSFTQLEAAALLVLYAFVGFENSVVPAGETADPQRTIPRALIATIVSTAALYFLIQLAFVAVMEPGEGREAPLLALGTALFGPAGGLALTIVAVCSILGNVSGGVTGTTRTTYAMGRDGLLPGWFGRVNARYATPVNSIVFMGALIALLAVSGNFVVLAAASTLARLIIYSVCIASLPKHERPTSIVWAMMAAGVAVCVWAAIRNTNPNYPPAVLWSVLAALVVVGTLLYAAARVAAARKGKVSSIQPPPSTREPS